MGTIVKKNKENVKKQARDGWEKDWRTDGLTDCYFISGTGGEILNKMAMFKYLST